MRLMMGVPGLVCSESLGSERDLFLHLLVTDPYTPLYVNHLSLWRLAESYNRSISLFKKHGTDLELPIPE